MDTRQRVRRSSATLGKFAGYNPSMRENLVCFFNHYTRQIFIDHTKTTINNPLPGIELKQCNQVFIVVTSPLFPVYLSVGRKDMGSLFTFMNIQKEMLFAVVQKGERSGYSSLLIQRFLLSCAESNCYGTGRTICFPFV